MNRLSHRIMLIVLLTFIWCILNESFDLYQLATGIVVSFITILILRMIQPNRKQQYNYSINLFYLVKYLLFLILDIYRSSFRTIKHLIKGEINPQFVATESKIRKPWLQAIIANSITLTPGTVTVHLADGNYTVLWLYPLTIRHKDIHKHLIYDFENLLVKEDKNA